MKGRFCCSVMILPILCWVSIASRPDPNSFPHQPGTVPSPQRAQITFSSQKGDKSMGEVANVKEGRKYAKGRKVGSSPPSCHDKCYGCTPCEAVQIPTSGGGHLRVQYANYAPEHWQCKCGPSFYDPYSKSSGGFAYPQLNS